MFVFKSGNFLPLKRQLSAAHRLIVGSALPIFSKKRKKFAGKGKYFAAKKMRAEARIFLVA